jgi:formylglycine-generating enzyme required for sulfatase activity
VRVSWLEAVAFCEWLSKETGRAVRLPTEAQWEWAARAGSDRPFWWGGVEADFASYANLADVTLADFSGNPYEQDRVKARYGNPENIYDNWIPQIPGVNDGGFLTEASGRWKPNPWGLSDLHGNAAEWTHSKEAAYPYRDDDGRNATAGGERRIVRGGSWYDRPKYATSSVRRSYRPYQKVYNVGFRVAVED